MFYEKIDAFVSLNISNQQARHIAIHCSGLSNGPAVPCNKSNLLELIQRLGYVQLDPIKVVARAHDHILWSRNTNYQPKHLDTLLEKERSIFEHFCHDACVLPMDSLPYWKQQFKRKAKLFTPNSGRNNLLSKKEQRRLLARLTDEGPLCSRDFKVTENDKLRATWSKPAHKQTLDYLWLSGSLAVSKREKFTKYYDLAERIFPQSLVDTEISEKERITWLSTHALTRIGFGTHAEINRFWEASSLDETKRWCATNASDLTAVTIGKSDGAEMDAMTLRSNKQLLQATPPPSKKIKILNPFDPLIRDRKRLAYLFGFDYRIEMYVPADKRRYGYYVYPLLEFDKFIGRIEVRHDRDSNQLCVDNLWHEAGVQFGKQRMQKLNSELVRLKRFCKADSVSWSK